MPELPEMLNRAGEMKKELVAKTISGVEVLQPKCLNLSPEAFAGALTGATITDVSYRGKWVQAQTTQGVLWLCLGMGGEILLVTRESLPPKHRLIIDFADATCLAINFWWFGYAHYAPPDWADDHVMTAKLGPNAIDVTATDLRALLKGRRGNIKAFLLNQANLAGIGNFYVQDILFLARLHPLHPINTLTNADIDRLAQAIQDGLQPSINKGGAFYEQNLYGRGGGFSMDDILIGYKEDQPCPVCQTPIQKLKTGSTSSFICPTCQPEQA